MSNSRGGTEAGVLFANVGVSVISGMIPDIRYIGTLREQLNRQKYGAYGGFAELSSRRLEPM
jgi:hypothetical protein